MQAGHFAASLAIATYFDWNIPTVLYSVGIHWLPNADALAIKAGWAKDDFHCSITHTFLFAFLLSGLISIFSRYYVLLTLVNLVVHMIVDLPSTIGQQLFWPISKRKFTLALWEDTGFWGRDTIKGCYRQKWPWILESAAFAFLIYRLIVIH
jgi:membrane-bound metal-dependent hydrolase YbcI (DUF457 family)